jgi:hypothetical protein
MESLAFDRVLHQTKQQGWWQDLVSLQNFRNWIDMSPKHYWCGDIRSSLLSYLDSVISLVKKIS